jgi:hypothetical protein
MSGFPALKEYKSKLFIGIGAHVYKSDLLKGGALNIILGFLSVIVPWSPIILRLL